MFNTNYSSYWLTATALSRPAHLALIADGEQYTFAELNGLVEKMAHRLKAVGIERGTLAAVLLPNCADFVIVIHALARLGAILIPLNIRLTSDELRWQLEQTRCKVLIYGAATEQTTASLSDVVGVSFAINAAPNETKFKRRPTPLVGGESFQMDGIDFNALQSIVFTSGTTGHPKGAALTWSNHFWSATASAFRLGLMPDDRWLCCLPLYHVGGLAIILRASLYGMTIVLHNGFDLEAIVESLHQNRVTLISLVPTMLYRLLNAEMTFPDSLRLVLLGGAAADSSLIERCQTLNIPVAPTYGLSEACSQVATMLPDEAYRKPGSVGKPLTFTSVKIVDENGASVPTGEYGEVVVSGSTVFAGYYNNNEATAKTLRNGELYTGDIGYLDSDGDLWLVQRRSDLIVSGGENIYPAEIERVLREHPAVAEVCVVGIPSPEWGQQVAAAIVLKADTKTTSEDLIAYSRQHLAGYKQPRLIKFVDSLPQTASGKIQRHTVSKIFGEIP